MQAAHVSNRFIFSAVFKKRKKARRIIHGIIVHHEFDWVEVRIKQLANVVDVFVIQESNITSGKYKQ